MKKLSKVKDLLSLQKKSRERSRKKLFIVEGIKEFQMALKGGYLPDKILIYREILKTRKLEFSEKITEISSAIFLKIAYRNSNGGIIAVFKQKQKLLKTLKLKDYPLILVIESIENPGNIGAILRTANAVSVDAIVFCNTKTDTFNPNVIRSSLGSLFTTNFFVETSYKLIYFLRKKKIKIFSTVLQKKYFNIYKVDFRDGLAIVIGNEAEGLSKIWMEISDKLIKIPMNVNVDSLNVSNVAAIILFEILRQRSNSKIF
ncbi:MAG TPA: TrmH family RNA methyltransferase [Candidatus Angelobacter sp.]|jgi:TrmH family RNA methyltransferase|nr:TrmH family RNA methyltransferase [Candidatus Angelobacter sp.]